MPTNHRHTIATYHAGNDEVLKMAVENSLEAKKDWENLPQHERWFVSFLSFVFFLFFLLLLKTKQNKTKQ